MLQNLHLLQEEQTEKEYDNETENPSDSSAAGSVHLHEEENDTENETKETKPPDSPLDSSAPDSVLLLQMEERDERKEEEEEESGEGVKMLEFSAADVPSDSLLNSSAADIVHENLLLLQQEAKLELSVHKEREESEKESVGEEREEQEAADKEKGVEEGGKEKEEEWMLEVPAAMFASFSPSKTQGTSEVGENTRRWRNRTTTHRTYARKLKREREIFSFNPDAVPHTPEFMFGALCYSSADQSLFTRVNPHSNAWRYAREMPGFEV